MAIVLTDPGLPDNPVTYVNPAFEALTLYSREFAVGRNCRFLQGKDTDPADVQRMRRGLLSRTEFEVTLTNHKADGTPFRNNVLIAPIFDEKGALTAYFGLLRKVPEAERGDAERAAHDVNLALLQELQHRVKNHLAMIVSMIRVQASREVTPESLKAVSRRIESLALLYEELLGRSDADTNEIAAGAYLSRVASVLSGIQARGSIRTNVECDDIALPVETAARLGLLLSEFLTNAYQHAFDGQSSGFVEVRFHRTGALGVRLSVADDGIGMPEGSRWPFGADSLEDQHDRARSETGALDTTGHGRPGVGGSIVAALSTSLGARLQVASPGRGTIVTVDIEA
jgi:PAS domain S-box-containing protein